MRRRTLIPLVIVMLLAGSMAGTLSAGATYHEDDDHNHGEQNGDHAWANAAFERTWGRTDYPVKNLGVARTWIWGPGPNDAGAMEHYAEAPGGMRMTQYTDKSRMEDNSWRTMDEPWDVTNGLLVVEMMDGRIQTGDNLFEQHPFGPSDENVAGDPGPDNGPTYDTMDSVRDEPAAADGALLTQRLALDGTITNDPALAAMNITAAAYVSETDHTVASVFLAFMQSSGPVWVDDMLVTERLFINDFYATGYPVTEAYWADVRVGGTVRTVLLQCFERRCLTYTPGNPDGWLVEAGNVGQHYYHWRYGDHTTPVLPEERLFYAILYGDQEVPPVETEASGVASFFLSDDGLTLHYHITFDGLTNVTMGHIHSGAVGANGDILVWLFPADGPPASAPTDLAMVSGAITADDLPDGTSLFDLVEMLATGDTYVNFHTTDYPGGEVRGQIQRPENKLFFFAMLTNDQEVVTGENPQPDTGATGMTTLRYNQADGTITCDTTVNDIVDVTMAHIHLAPFGSNGGVITWLFPADGPPPSAPITPDGELECATITEDRLNISDDVAATIGGKSLEAFVYQMLIGNTYVNVHTSAFPAGEIRGQIWLD